MKLVSCVMVLAACGASGNGPRTPHEVWSYNPDAYISEYTFLEDMVLSPDVVVMAGSPQSPPGGMGVVALDAKTGKQLWGRDGKAWLVHPPRASDPLYVVPLDGDCYTRAERVDAKTGAVRATVALPKICSMGSSDRIAWSKRGLLVIVDDKLTAYDWTTGAALWSATVDKDASGFAPVVTDERVYVGGATATVIALADGKQLASISTGLYREPLVASPDGRHVFVATAGDRSIELDDQLGQHPIAGRVRAASDAYYAVANGRATENVGRIDILAYGKSDPVAVLAARDSHDAYGAVGLTDRAAFYYHAADGAFVMHDLSTGKTDRVHEVTSRLVVTTEYAGSAPAFMNTPPVIAGPYLFLRDSNEIHGYVLGDG